MAAPYFSDRQRTLYIIDASSFLYRAYYALKPLHAPSGEPVHAVYGFCRMMKKLLNGDAPAGGTPRGGTPVHAILVWDGPGPTERHTVYADYKATRQKAPADLGDQRALIQEWADAIGLHQLSMPGIEADDLIYSLTKEAVAASYYVVIVSSDKDLGQLVSDKVVMYDTFKDVYNDTRTLETKYGFSLDRLAFYFALLGDSSDNIPGVPGIGPKTATDLVTRYTTLDDLYAHIEEVSSARMRELLLTHRDSAYLSLQLFMLRYHQTQVSVSRCVLQPEGWARAYDFYKRLGFVSLVPKQVDNLPLFATQDVPQPVTQAWQAHAVTTRAQIDTLCAAIRQAGACAVDTETNGAHPLRCVLAGISLCYESTTAYYVPLVHDGVDLDIPYAKKCIGEILSDPAIKKYLHNAKFDRMVLESADIPLRGVVFDTMLAASLVQQVAIDGRRVGLKLLSELYLNEPMRSFDEVVKGAGVKNFMQLPLDVATQYAALDARQTFLLVPILQNKLAEFEQERLYYDLELPLNDVLYDMERVGIPCDRAMLDALDIEVRGAVQRLHELIVDLVGPEYREINLNSPQQVSKLLFEHLKLEPVKKTAKKSGHSTDAEVLEELAAVHPVPGLIATYRELSKIKSTYIDGLRAAQFPDGTIHTSFSQTYVITGRLSSFEPNIQNLPTAGVMVDGKRVGAIRAAFKPFPGDLFLSADYSQMELRILAHFSQDQNLCTAFLQQQDIHARTAAGIFDIPLDAVTHEQRQLGKRINFSILYGLTPYGLSQDLHISMSDAKKYIERYFAHYPGVRAWMDETVARAIDCGYVSTLWGRRRYLPGLLDKNKTVFDAARRVAINTPVQGTAAELAKQGMIAITQELRAQNLQAKLVAQIHDELLFSVPESEITVVTPLVTQVLERVVTWQVPLQVTTRIGADWDEVTK